MVLVLLVEAESDFSFEIRTAVSHSVSLKQINRLKETRKRMTSAGKTLRWRKGVEITVDEDGSVLTANSVRYISYLTGVSSGQARSPGHISILNTAAHVVLIGCDVSLSRFLLIDLTWRKSVFNFKSTESFIVWFSFWNVMICCFSSSLLTVNEEIFVFFGEFVGQKTCEVVTLSSGKLWLED